LSRASRLADVVRATHPRGCTIVVVRAVLAEFAGLAEAARPTNNRCFAVAIALAGISHAAILTHLFGATDWRTVGTIAAIAARIAFGAGLTDTVGPAQGRNIAVIGVFTRIACRAILTLV